MTPDTFTRKEFEDRLADMRAEFHAAQLQQDTEWNLGFRAIREDVKHGIDAIREDVATRSDALENLFNARLDPVKAVSYGMVGFLMLLLGAILTGVLKR